MRRTARAIIVKDNQLLVMQRNKFGTKYCALIGGGIDAGETPEEALHREIMEESSITVTNPRLVIIENAGDVFGMQYIYTCDYVSGEPALSPESEEWKITALGQNLYEPAWLPLSDLESANMLPHELVPVLQQGIRKGFAAEPIQLTIQ